MKKVKWVLKSQSMGEVVVTDIFYNPARNKSSPWSGVFVEPPNQTIFSGYAPVLYTGDATEIHVDKSDISSLAWLTKLVNKKPTKENRQDFLFCIKVENGLATSTDARMAVMTPLNSGELKNGVYLVHRINDRSVVVSDVSDTYYVDLSYLTVNRKEFSLWINLSAVRFPLFDNTIVCFGIETDSGEKIHKVDAGYMKLALEGASEAALYFGEEKEVVKVVAVHRPSGKTRRAFIMPILESRGIKERFEMTYNMPDGFTAKPQAKAKVRIFCVEKGEWE